MISIATSDILEIVKNYIDPPTYRAKGKLIKILFADKTKYINQTTGEVNSVKIINTLKNNGLLSLSFQAAQTLNLTFHTNTKPLLSMRVINDVLESMGYTYYLTKSMSKNGDNIIWSVNLNTQNIVDPIVFREKLSQQGCQIHSIKKNGSFSWAYDIQTDNARLNALSLPSSIPQELGRPNRAYWLHVKGASGVRIKASPYDRWFPHITLFDNALVPIDEISLDTNKKNLDVKIPQNAKYIRIDDKFLLDNIKRGLEVTLLD